MSFLVEAKDVHKSYGSVNVLKGATVELERGAQYSLVGSSGSGKSTLLYLLGGLDIPSRGTIRVDGRDLAKLSSQERARFRNEVVGFVFQSHFLLPTLSAKDNILLPVHIKGDSPKDYEKDIQSLAERLKITHCLPKRPYELSGGEQQRVNILRSLVLRPKLLLCDEPTGNLDSKSTQNVVNLLSELARNCGSTLLIVTHDEQVATHFERTLEMVDGVVCPSIPEDLYTI